MIECVLKGTTVHYTLHVEIEELVDKIIESERIGARADEAVERANEAEQISAQVENYIDTLL